VGIAPAAPRLGSGLAYHCPIGSPTPRRWRSFIDHLLELGEDSFDLLVIDTALTFLPAAQSYPSGLRKAHHELRVVIGYPAGVLLLHQTSAVRTRSGARGPLAAFADIVIDMQLPRGDRFTRRRYFHGVGRYPGTLQHVAGELNADGTDYVLLSVAPAEASVAPTLETLRKVLSDVPAPLTRQEILSRWPASELPPRADSLWRSLAHFCALGILVRTGEGIRGEAFRYELAEWRPGS